MAPLLHYEVHGERGPCVLMVHGFLSSRAQWLPNLEALSEWSRPVVIELFGHGRSPSPVEPERYMPAHYAAEFEAIRERLGIERWLVVGQSLGAALTLRYALDYPSRVVAQVFTNSMSALAGDGWDTRVRPVMQEQARAFDAAGRSAIDSHPLNPLRSRRLPADMRIQFEEDNRLHDPRGLAMTGLHTVPGSSVRSHICENRVPTLLIAGRREARFEEYRRFAAKMMPQTEVVVLDGGHAVNIDAAREFNAAVRTFFGKHAS